MEGLLGLITAGIGTGFAIAGGNTVQKGIDQQKQGLAQEQAGSQITQTGAAAYNQASQNIIGLEQQVETSKEHRPGLPALQQVLQPVVFGENDL